MTVTFLPSTYIQLNARQASPVCKIMLYTEPYMTLGTVCIAVSGNVKKIKINTYIGGNYTHLNLYIRM